MALDIFRTNLIEEFDKCSDCDVEEGPRALGPPHEVPVGAEGGREDAVTPGGGGHDGLVLIFVYDSTCTLD